MKPVLKVEQLEKYYGSKGTITKAVDGISFEIVEGEFVGIMGASGSGKTTLLNCVSTIDKATSGKIILRDQELTSIKSRKLAAFRRNELGFIFQDFNLLDTLTGFENIALALTILKENPVSIQEKVGAMAKQLNIEHILEKFPFQMSGGEKQRVASARAMITNPSLILADEPTGALDSKSARQLLESFQHLNERLKATIMMVTHDAFTASYCHRIIFIKDGKIFNELIRGTKQRKAFFNDIMEVLTFLGGDVDVL
ncbi:MAG: ABC transporter ATP-binding protein [Clostridia bacterium]|nr:ABC transporter ATP-binding protein [Clostridia bacterium]